MDQRISRMRIRGANCGDAAQEVVAEIRVALADADEEGEEGLLDRALILERPIDPVLDRFPYSRDGGEPLGPHRLHVREHHRAYGLRVGDAGAGSEDDVLDYALEGVPDREDGEEDVARADMDQLGRRSRSGGGSCRGSA